MLKSMTGYGRGSTTLYNRKFTVEIKSVNHRYNDITIKMPKILNIFEDKIKRTITDMIIRGKTDVFIYYESYATEDVTITVNNPLIKAYMQVFNELKNTYNLKDEPSLDLIANLQDVLTIDKNVEDDNKLSQMWEALSIALEMALKQFMLMRQTEGGALKKDILQKLCNIEGLASRVKERAPIVVSEYKLKFMARIKEMLNNIEPDENRLFTEIAVFTDRICIDEEITRLESHISQMKGILQQNESIGRKLDFLTQEMNREVNTIGSKANDIEISKFTVELKSELEKIREQVQNIE